MTVTTAREAMLLSPRAFLSSSWPWRCSAYLASGVLLGALTGLALVAMALAGAALTIVLIGLVLILGVLVSGVVIARWERRRLWLVDERPTVDPHEEPEHPGRRAWLSTRLRERWTWRELGYAVVSAAALCWIDLAVLLLTWGVVTSALSQAIVSYDTWYWFAVSLLVVAALVPLAMYVVAVWATARGEITRAVVSPDELALGRRLTEVTASRSALSEAFDVERRRIERDLHDGAQQRLTALNVTLGMALLDLPEDSAAVRRIREAQRQTRLALGDVRDLVRGIHPQVLTERGLAEAVQDVASRTATATKVDVDVPRLDPAVESAAYFCVTEALTNVDRHARARHASVLGRMVDDVLVVQVEDDGIGGAQPGPRSGITGLRARLTVLDGTLSVTSPPGGPTHLRMEVPCRPVCA